MHSIVLLILPVLVCSFELSVLNKPIIGGSTKPIENFDPLNLSEDNERLVFYREAELKHSRLAMISTVTIPLVEQYTNRPAIYEFSRLPDNYQSLIIGLMFISEFSSMLLGWERPDRKRFTIKDIYQPGDLGFNLAKDIDIDMVNKELNNGRLAMIASLGMIVQELVTNKTLF